jgi:hypothetical protein
MSTTFVLSASDMDSIVAAKILCHLHPGATHLSSTRRNMYLPDGSTLYIVRGYMGVARLKELSNQYNIIVYDLDISDEFKAQDVLRSCKIDLRFAPTNMTISEFVWQSEATGETPLLVKLTRDYMRWEFNYDESIPFHYSFDLLDPKFGNSNQPLFAQLLTDKDDSTIFGMVEQGTRIQRYIDKLHTLMCKELVFTSEIVDSSVLCANVHGASSLFFESINDLDSYDMAMTFRYDPSMHKVGHTLYAVDPEVDVSMLAHIHGGGGHKHSAGFTEERLICDRSESHNYSGNQISNMLEVDGIDNVVLDYLAFRIYGYQRNAFYGTYHGQEAVFYNSPYIVPGDFFRNIELRDSKVAVQFWMNAAGIYVLAAKGVNSFELGDEFGNKIGPYRVTETAIIVDCKFYDRSIGNDVFWPEDEYFTTVVTAELP